MPAMRFDIHTARHILVARRVWERARPAIFARATSALLLAALLLPGCATTPVQPWERGRLARWDMRFDPDPLQGALKQHTRFSKEGSSGSVGAAGGGCGCN